MTPTATYTFADTDVAAEIVTDPQGDAVSSVPPWYCATMSGVLKLQSWLKTQGVSATILEDYPMKYWNTSYFGLAKVPWLSDGKGAEENAGGLIWNFKVLPYSMAATIAVSAFTLDDTQ